MRRLILLVPFLLWAAPSDSAEITRIWLTHRSNNPGQIVINWMTPQPGNSVVDYALDRAASTTIGIDEEACLHHVEIPISSQRRECHYRVRTGNDASQWETFKICSGDIFRAAVIADWQGKPDLSAILKDDIHLLLTAGDNISRLWERCGPGENACVTPYAELIDRYPELFRSTPFMPVLGNHDKEIRPRGKTPPNAPVYDIGATAFRRFFELPTDEWKWYFDSPAFGIRFVALDLNHISDHGTTWQACHPYSKNSEQFHWYRDLMSAPSPRFVVTLYNERNANIRNQADGLWHQWFRKGTIAITGFGYFAERAELDGFTYYNTALNGRGTKYPDPFSKFLQGEDSYVLLTVTQVPAEMVVEIKGLNGRVLDRKLFKGAEQ